MSDALLSQVISKCTDLTNREAKTSDVHVLRLAYIIGSSRIIAKLLISQVGFDYLLRTVNVFACPHLRPDA